MVPLCGIRFMNVIIMYIPGYSCLVFLDSKLFDEKIQTNTKRDKMFKIHDIQTHFIQDINI